MNKIFCLFLFLLCGCVSSVSQKKTPDLVCIQITDRNGFSETISTKERLDSYTKTDFLQTQPYKQVLRIFAKNEQGKTSSKLTSYYPNGNLFQYLEIMDARAFGKYKEFYPEGGQKIGATVIGGPADLRPSSQKEWLFDGITRSWDEKGNLLSEISYRQGELEGPSLYYYPDKKLWKSYYFKKNELEGDAVEYKEDGSIFYQSSYQKGQKQGKSIGYWTEKQIFCEEWFENDLLRTATYFDSQGNVLSEIKNGEGKKVVFQGKSLHQTLEYHKGKLDGEVVTLSPSGESTLIFHIKNGLKQGEEIEFYTTDEITNEKKEPVKKISLHWDEGILHGSIKTWYPNGQQESQREIFHNKRNGVSCAWYPNGSVMLIEEYENDQLLNGSYFKLSNKIPVSTVNKGDGIASLYDEKGCLIRSISYQKGKPVDN